MEPNDMRELCLTRRNEDMEYEMKKQQLQKVSFDMLTRQDVMASCSRTQAENTLKYGQKMQQRSNLDALAQKAAMQERVRIERDDTLKYEQKLALLQKERLEDTLQHEKDMGLEALLQKTAMQERIRSEREETLEYDKKMIENEKVKISLMRERLLLDPKSENENLKKRKEPETKEASAAQTFKLAATRHAEMKLQASISHK